MPARKAKYATYKKPSDIKVGVIGYGGAFNMGKAHMSQMKKAGMTPFAVCEIDPARLEVAEADFPGIETYGSLDKMLKQSDVDLIVHITPHNLHYKLAAQCVRAGKHVVTEKPFVVTTSEADRLIKQADHAGVMVTTYHNRHWDGWIVRAVREVVDKGVIGDVFRVEANMGGYGLPKDWWRTSQSISGGILYDWGVHLLEYTLQIIKDPVVEVSGFAKTGYWESKAPKDYPWLGDMNEDDAHAVVRFAGGQMAHLNITQLRSEPALDPAPLLVLIGTKGTYAMTWKEWTTRIANRKGELVEKKGKHPKSEGGLIYYKNVAEHLCGKADLVITPQWARRPIHIIDLAMQSARKGKALAAKDS
ncbi:MAG: Gfo/Idh/MocA family oxidoreductase [Planctomycetota bacterium]